MLFPPLLSSNWKYLPSRELVELSSLGKSEIYSIHYLLFDDDFLSLRANSPGRYCAPPPERPGELVPRLDFLNPFDIKPILRACLHGMGVGLVGLVSFVFTLWGTQNKRNLPH